MSSRDEMESFLQQQDVEELGSGGALLEGS